MEPPSPEDLKRIIDKALKDGARLEGYHPVLRETGSLYLYLVTEKSRSWGQEYYKVLLLPNVWVLVGHSFVDNYRHCF